MDGLKTLAISGWAQPVKALENLVPHADFMDYAHTKSFANAYTALSQREYDLVIGWSLGGILARKMMLQGALKAQHFIMVGSPYQYVRDNRMPHAMPREVFEVFYANYRDDTHRTVSRFDGLMAKGDKHHKRIMHELEHHHEVLNPNVWLPWLDELEHYSAAHDDYSALPPTLIVHGTEDVIVSFPQAQALHNAIPHSRLLAVPECGHAPHLHDVQMMRQAIQEFVTR